MLLWCLLSALPFTIHSQNVNKQLFPKQTSIPRMEINLPMVNGFIILKGDFHIHTVFSDGMLWPTMRVQEAWETGLDVLSITDHIEYPNTMLKDTNLNASYDLALPHAKECGILLVRGAEITRQQGVIGHFNALFIKDANRLKIKDPEAALQEALDQEAFVVLNHPGWNVDTCVITEFQAGLLKRKMIHGVEVFGVYREYYPRALSWSKDLDLTVMANSDMHDLIYTDFGQGDGKTPYRPMTLIFAREKSLEAVKEALFSKRTLACFDGQMAGREDLLKAFFSACVKISYVSGIKDMVVYNLTNSCDFPFSVRIGEKVYEIYPQGSTNVHIGKNIHQVEMVVENMHHYEFSHPTITMQLPSGNSQ